MWKKGNKTTSNVCEAGFSSYLESAFQDKRCTTELRRENLVDLLGEPTEIRDEASDLIGFMKQLPNKSNYFVLIYTCEDPSRKVLIHEKMKPQKWIRTLYFAFDKKSNTFVEFYATR